PRGRGANGAGPPGRPTLRRLAGTRTRRAPFHPAGTGRRGGPVVRDEL
ncbi:MAG: Uracil phosphoribosyltransferase, partial [uncultured Thermomicrobiales bacterium]